MAEFSPRWIGALYVLAVTVPLWRVDVREHRLPNALVLPGFAFAGVGLVWQALIRGSPGSCTGPVLIGAAVGVAMLVLGSGGGLGMGDVKLATLLALTLASARGAEPAAAVAFLAAAFLAGGTMALARFAEVGPRPDVPFGPVLLAAFWTVVVLW